MKQEQSSLKGKKASPCSKSREVSFAISWCENKWTTSPSGVGSKWYKQVSRVYDFENVMGGLCKLWLRSIELWGKTEFSFMIWISGHQSAQPPPPTTPLPQQNYLGVNDIISIFVRVLSFECWDSLLWTIADGLFILRLKSVLMAFKNFAAISSRNVYDFSQEQKAVVCLRVVYPLLFDQN